MKKACLILLAALLALGLLPGLADESITESSGGVSPQGALTIQEADPFADSALKVGEYTLADGVYTAASGGTFTYDAASGVMTITGGSITLSTEGTSGDCVVVDGAASLTLNNVNILPAKNNAAIKINAGATANITLTGNNTLTGKGQYAGLAVQWQGAGELGTAVIDGSGTLTATGGSNSAGIGGSKTTSEKGVCGNITINGGTINAIGGSNAAGIGTSDNPANGASSGSSKFVDGNWGTITINGGTINATGNGSGAGIGGGNHSDSGDIIINGGTIVARGTTGIGCGLGNSKNQLNAATGQHQSPGYYYANVTITGGNIQAYAADSSRGAGIGGAQYCDAIINISGNPTIIAKGGMNSAIYAGGAGIGGGYQGAARVIISGNPYIEATGGRGAPGIGNGTAQSGMGNTSYNKIEGSTNLRGNPAVPDSDVLVSISGGTIYAYAGNYAAGIGGAYSSNVCRVNISGGNVHAYGYSGGEGNPYIGGAGIGSGVGKNGHTEKTDYEANTTVCDINVTGGTVYAEGGWGAAGIGSGAGNVRASHIGIGSDAAIEAYSDGIKFALDTRGGSNTSVSDAVFQGTFMFPWDANSGSQNARGLKHVTVENQTGSGTASASLPSGYRSFAVTAGGSGDYTVYSTDSTIAGGNGAYFSASSAEGDSGLGGGEQPANKNGNTILMPLSSGSLSDNYFLYPVKTIRVDKKVATDGTVDAAAISMTAYFRLKLDGEDTYLETPGMQSVAVVNGISQGPAFFVNVPVGNYSVIETDAQGERLALHTVFGAAELKSIETSDHHSSDGSDNTGIVSDTDWSDDVTVTNTFTMLVENTSIPVKKVWSDENNRDGLRPASVTVYLLADGQRTEQATLNADNGWAHTFADQPIKKDGREIVYTVEEAAVTGYTASIAGDAAAGYTITNAHVPERINIPVTKTWVDDNNRDGRRPASVTINLLANGRQIDSHTVTGTGNTWSYTFANLNKYEGGKEIAYTVTENAVADYTAAINGFNITNTHTVVRISISGTKTWVDQNNADGIRPVAITVNLLANGAIIQTQEVTGAGNTWSYTFANAPRYQGGREISYTVSENAVSGYTTTISGFNITNTHTVTPPPPPPPPPQNENISISGTKTWVDQGNADGLRPASITVNLLADGVQVDSQTVTGSGDSWAFTFENVPRYANGREIAYTVSESEVPGYTAAYAGTSITNTHEPERVSVSGVKTWDDQNDADGLRPDSITVSLLADGARVRSQTVSGSTGWRYTFSDLPKYVNGREIAYTVSESAVEGYTTAVSGYDLINTHVPASITISGTKTWVDHGNRDGIRPGTVIIRLLANGAEKQSRTVSGTGDTWAFTFTGLPEYENGAKVNYTITEDPVPGYETTVTGYDVYNTHASEEPDPRQYTLIVRYWADGRKVFPDFKATHRYGDPYNVVSPALAGYTVDKPAVSGVIYRDTEWDVYYTPGNVKLTVYYQYLDGTTAADTHYETLHAGDAYSVPSPVIPGYTANILLVSGVMPGHDMEYVVIYVPQPGTVPEEDPEQARRRGSGLTVIDDFDTPLGLGGVEVNAGECFD